jgi:hypothetical protein
VILVWVVLVVQVVWCVGRCSVGGLWWWQWVAECDVSVCSVGGGMLVAEYDVGVLWVVVV